MQMGKNKNKKTDDTQILNQSTKQRIPQMFRDAGSGIGAAERLFGDLGLKMNTEKTSQALARVHPVPELRAGDNIVATEPVVKNLGVYLDQNMTFSAHVDHLVTEMCEVLPA